MSAFPAHASPVFLPQAAPPILDASSQPSTLSLDDREKAPPPLVSPAITSRDDPIAHVGHHHRHDRLPRAIPVAATHDEDGSEQGKHARLLETLPEVTCEVRARIPTTTGQEMFLHLYHNSADEKEHLAIVFGPHIRSRSLDRPRPGETERDRMIRGAYTGTLYPGRTSSRIDQLKKEAGVASHGTGTTGELAISRPDLNITREPGSQFVTSTTETPDVSKDHEYVYPPELGPPLVRIHSECYTGETVWSARCDCGEQLDEAARLMSLPAPTPGSTPQSEMTESSALRQRLPSSGGVIIYLRQEGRGIGLLSKLKAYNLQDLGHDTMEANLLLRHPGDARSYGLATAMLLDLGLGGDRGIRLLTNNPEKVRAVEGPNRQVRVVERVPMIPLAWKSGGKEGFTSPEVEKYISTKIEKFKHMFSP